MRVGPLGRTRQRKTRSRYEHRARLVVVVEKLAAIPW